MNQYYGQYSKGQLRLASEYRRTYIDAVNL